MIKFFRLTALCVAVSVGTFDAYSWGSKGHDVVCAVAERHLTDEARRRVSEIFEGKSLVYWANWMDNASYQPEYRYSKTWHYANVDAGEEYEKVIREKSGHIVCAIEAQVEFLKKSGIDRDREAVSLRMLVHLLGDLHAPMHMGHHSDRGGNKVQVQYFNRGRNLHSIWDSDLVNGAHSWSYSEWREQIDTDDAGRIAEIVAGTPFDWGKETYRICGEVYKDTPSGAKLSYDYLHKWAYVIEDQLLKGGLRLAALLNDIYK